MHPRRQEMSFFDRPVRTGPGRGVSIAAQAAFTAGPIHAEFFKKSWKAKLHTGRLADFVFCYQYVAFKPPEKPQGREALTVMPQSCGPYDMTKNSRETI